MLPLSIFIRKEAVKKKEGYLPGVIFSIMLFADPSSILIGTFFEDQK
jgi:hypothetical protein